MTNFPKVEINVGPSGTGRIIVDGKDISDGVSALTLRVRAGYMTQLFIVMTADVVAAAETDLVKVSPIAGRVRYEKKP